MTIIPTPISDVLDARRQQYEDALTGYQANEAQAHAQAALIAEYRLRSPGLPAGAYASMAQAGYDPNQLDTVSQQYVPDPNANTVDLKGGAAQPASAKPKPKPQHHGGGGLLGAIGGAIDSAVGGVAGGVKWATDKVVDDSFKPAIRLGTATLESAAQLGANVIEQNAPHGGWGPFKNSATPSSDRSLLDDFRATTLGQMIAHSDYGTGFLAPQSERAAAGVMQRAVRGSVGDYAHGGPHAATIGRVASGTVFTPGSQPYNIASGVVDAYVSAKYDPSNVLGKAWHAAAVTHNTFAPADELAQAGAFNGLRKYFNPTTFGDWVDSAKGRITVPALANESSADAIDYMTKGKLPPSLVADLAHAQTPEEVTALLHDAVSDGLRYIPKASAIFGVGGAKYAVSKTLGTRDWRILNLVPGYGFDINDDRAAVNYVQRAASNALVKGDARESLVNQMFDAVSTEDPSIRAGKIYKTMNDLGTQIRQSVGGSAYLDTAEGKRFATDLIGAARAGAPDDVRAMLEHNFPGQTFKDDYISSIMHTAAGTPSAAQRAQRVLEVLGRDNPDLSWVDRRAASIPEDATSGVDLARYRDQATPLASLMDASTTRSDVRNWLTTAFPDATFSDSTVNEMARIAKGGSQTDDMADLLREGVQFGRSHQSAQVAQRLGRWSSAQTLEARQGFIDAGAPDSIPSIKLGDAVYKIQGMHLPDEALNGFVPGPNADDIRRNTSMFNNLLGASPDNNRPYFSLLARDDGHERLMLTALDRASGAWRRLAVSRPALTLRVLGGQQLAMAMDGQDSFFSHPIRAIAHVLHSDQAVDMTDSRFLDSLDETRSQWRRALGTDPSSNFGIDKVQLGRTARITPEMKDFVPSWGSEISQLGNSTLSRSVANALLSPIIEREGTQINALDDLKQSFWNGPMSKLREGLLAGSDPYDESHWTNVLRSQEGSDKYIDTVVDRVMQKTVGDDDLMHAVATGTLGGEPLGNGKTISGALRSKLADLHADEVYPALVKGRVQTGIESKGLLDKAQQWFWQHMVDVPSSQLTKQPLGAQLYAQEVARLVGPSTDWRTVLDAMEHGDTSAIRTALEGAPSELTASEVDALARTHVLNSLDRYVYNGHEKAQFTDILHTLVPFAEVFRQEMKRWAVLAGDNLPSVLRRGSQVVQNSRDDGFFFTNPTTGQESVHIPLPGIVQSIVGAVVPGAQPDPGAGLAAPVAGFNIVGQGLPGFGAVAAVPADAILKHTPGGNTIRKILEPYGPPDTSGGVSGFAQTLAPSWMRKIISGIDEDPQKDRMFASTLASTTIALQTAHPERYPNTPEGMNKLLSDASEAARQMLVIRGLAQAILPSPPSLDQKIKVNDHWVELSAITAAWQKLEHDALANGQPISDAVSEFINTYGQAPALAMVPQSVPTVYGLAASQAMVDWKKNNADFAGSFKNVWPLFAPAPGDTQATGSDYNNYLFQLSDGSRKTLDAQTRFQLRDYRIGSMLYDRARGQLPTSPNADQRAWLASEREKIGELYPGYAANDGQFPPGALGKVKPDVAIRELGHAAADPRVADTPLATAIRAYDQARSAAIAEVGTHSSTPFASQQAAPLRAWLRSVGQWLTEHYQGFGTAFDYVYSSEVQDHTTDNSVTAQDAAAQAAAQ